MKEYMWIAGTLAVCLAAIRLPATEASLRQADAMVDELVARETTHTVAGLITDVQRLQRERQQLVAALRKRNKELEHATSELQATRIEAQWLRQQLSAAESRHDTAATQQATLRGELERAIAATRHDRVTLAYNLGCVYKATRQYERAEREFLRALQLAPEDPAIHFNLGILYDDHLPNREKARQHYERFLELAPDDPDVPRVIQWLKELM